MSKFIFGLAIVLVLCSALACGDDVDSCSSVGEYKCDSGVVYMCKFDSDSGDKYWQAMQDCTESSTSGCTCAMVSGIAVCKSGGSACQGKYLD